MFWIKTIENLEQWRKRLMDDIMSLRHKYIEHDTEIIDIKNRINALLESNEQYQKTFEKISQDMQALDQMDKGLLECVKGDRKDINALIQLIKKSTKGKK